jgi:hypothetical protein
MKKCFVLLFLSLFLCNITYGQRVVTFYRYTIDSVLLTPHGDWAGDVQNDNPPWAYDAFATTAGGKDVVWYSNNNLGRVWGPKNTIYTTSDKMCTEVSAGKLDADNLIDAVSSFVRSDSVAYSFLAIHKNNGNGTFTTTKLDSIKARLRQTRLVDVNNDGLLDIIVAASAPRTSAIYESGVYWYKNNGSMSFTKNFIATADAWKIDAFDNVDGDKHLDLVAAEEFFSGQDTSAAARVILYKNNGAEGFSQVVIETNLGRHLGDPPGGGGVRCAKINNDDNKVDIVATSSYNGVLYWYKNNDGTSFTRYVIDNMATKIDGIDVGDFEPDGNMDIVACGRNSWVRWYHNNGNGTFTMNTIDTQYPLFDLPFVTYLDGDTCPDIVVTEATGTSGWVFSYLNHCVANVEEKTSIINDNWLRAPSIVGKNSVDITFGIVNKGKTKLEILDITGRVIDIVGNDYYETGVYKTFWNANEKPNGTYFLSLKSDNALLTTKKITIIR